jgi:transketolase
MYAASHNMDKIIATVDYNGRQIDGDVEDVLSLGNLKQKWQAFGWETIELDGNDIESLRQAFKEAKSFVGKGKPIMMLMRTEMGQGVDYMMGTHKWHGAAPNEEQLESALNQLEETLGDY